MKTKIQKKLLFSEIIPSEFVTLNCLYQERILGIDTQCEETVLRFCISLIETFCGTIHFPVIN